MALDPDTFVNLLVARLASVIPDDWNIGVQAGDITLWRDGQSGRAGSHIAQFFTELAANYANDADRMVAASQHVMSDVQDYLAECTTEPWPREASPMPTPHARLVAGMILFLWGDGQAPDCRLEPLEVEGDS